MTDSTLRVIITGDSAGAKRALKETEDAATATGQKVGDEMTHATSRIGGAFSSLGNIGANFGLPFMGSLDNIGKKFDDAKEHGTGFMAGMQTLGGATLLGLGAGLVAVGGESIHLAMNFDQAASQIAASANIPVSAAKKIADSFLSTSGQVTFSAVQIAQAYAGVAGELGNTQGRALSASEALDVMKASTDLAEATGGQLANTTSDLAAIMQTYGLKADQAGKTSDILYNTSNLTGQGLDSVTQVVQRLHAQLGVLTPSLADTSGLMVDLREHGETGRAAVSGVASAFSTLLGGSKAVKDEVASLGLNLYDANGNFVGMGNVIAQLQPKLAGMTQQQQMATLQVLLGKTASQKMLETILAGPDAFDNATKAVSRHGSAHQAAGTATDNLKGSAEKLKAELENEGVKIGEALMPKLHDLANITNDLITFFEKHRAVAEVLAGVIGGVLATAVAAFTYGHLKNMATSIKSMIDDVTTLGKKLANLITGGNNKVNLGIQDDADKAAADLKQGASDAGTEIGTAGQTASDDLKAGGTEAGTSLETGGTEAGTSLETAGTTAGTELTAAGTEAGAALDASGATAATELEGGATTAGATLDTAGAAAETEISAGGAEAGAALGTEGAAGALGEGGAAAALAGAAVPLGVVAASLAAAVGGAALINATMDQKGLGMMGFNANARGLPSGSLPNSPALTQQLQLMEELSNLPKGHAAGGIVPARAGGTVLGGPIGEGGQDEAIIPLPSGWDTDLFGGGDGTISITVPLQIDGQTVATAILPDMRISSLRRGRATVGGAVLQNT